MAEQQCQENFSGYQGKPKENISVASSLLLFFGQPDSHSLRNHFVVFHAQKTTATPRPEISQKFERLPAVFILIISC